MELAILQRYIKKISQPIMILKTENINKMSIDSILGITKMLDIIQSII